MGVSYTYFAAEDDTRAGAAVDDGPGDTLAPVVMAFDPVVQARTLMALLADGAYDATTRDADWARLVSPPDHEWAWVVSMPASFTAALAEATPERVAEVAVPWSRTDEFGGTASPEDLLPVLHSWRDLARTTTARDLGLYCWTTL
ncbi:hypothetical protein LEP48_02205 [Isoptericola sp. NEAU-Y5]|uniref:Uncharacterized protein n=1 Tax=Isoptericola luteus TaxID=2879484 RepID=A0ABS7ZCZ8_9MICO|nr:hypothetical protein [Isoptericola sp. NEAU-Y5]MCA5892161.1 hypothetical protein [Isoptericola sp. NEAU-Y5]